MSIPRTAPRSVPVSAAETKLADDVDCWRFNHRAFVSHFTHCRECGIDLCPDGQTIWDAADAAERMLPWRIDGHA